MAFVLTGRRAAQLAVILLAGAGLAACTTTEGTNALTDFGTFDREVIEPTAAGIGLAPQPAAKPDPTNPRGPLVMPKDTATLPPPQKATDVALLPEDSAKPKIDTTGLSTEDLNRLKHVLIVDLNTPDGRPLTAAELKKLTAQLKSFSYNNKRSIFTPPEQYFTLASGQQNMVCLAKSGDLVAVNDPACPAEIRSVLLKKT
ncbi:MAG: hypothetical protein ABI697_04980 [Devosia sp.]